MKEPQAGVSVTRTSRPKRSRPDASLSWLRRTDDCGRIALAWAIVSETLRRVPFLASSAFCTFLEDGEIVSDR